MTPHPLPELPVTLKACPFCGHAAFLHEHGEAEFWVAGCDAPGDKCSVSPTTLSQPIKAEAIAAWNRRAAVVEGWLPIESAPRDGLIDLWVDSGQRYTGCYWDSICGEYRTTGNSNVLICLPLRICKFWMPLPAAPAPPTGDT